MSDLDQLYPQPLHLPTGQPHNVADVPFAGRAGFADGRRRLNSSNIAAAIQDFETPVPNPSISNFEIGNFGAENAIIYFDGNKITLEQPSGQPYRYDYPGGSVTGIRLVLDVGVELSGGEYFIIEPIIAEAGAQASWQPSFVYIPDEDPPPHPRLLSYEFGVYVRGSGTVTDTGTDPANHERCADPVAVYTAIDSVHRGYSFQTARRPFRFLSNRRNPYRQNFRYRRALC